MYERADPRRFFLRPAILKLGKAGGWFPPNCSATPSEGALGSKKRLTGLLDSETGAVTPSDCIGRRVRVNVVSRMVASWK